MGVEEKLPSGILLTRVEKVVGYARKVSVWPATFGLACCAMELISTGGPRHDLARFGMERASNTPRQADLMIVAGRVSQKMAPVLRQIYDQMANPKWVISMGVCASSGGMFNNYAIVQGVDHIVPVDIYLPGCPPRPEMLLDSILKLHDKIQNMKLGINRELEVQELEQARLRRLPLAADLAGLQARGGRPVTSEENQENPPDEAALAGQQRLGEQVVRTGMFGTETTGDTSGYGGLQVRRAPLPSSPRPYGSYFDEITDALAARLTQDGSDFGEAVERVIVERGELTLHIRREHLVAVARTLRDEPSLAFELCGGVSGVHYLADTGRELHAVYHLTSITHNRRMRLEVSAPDADPHIPSVVDVYPACNWHERETWDFFGIIFDGHPALTRIEMPDDWKGHPQRKDYPLGGIPVEYRGATVPPPDERRSYT